MSQTLENRLWRHLVAGDPDDHWIWTGPVDKDGYGTIDDIGGRGGWRVRAHRAAWLVLVGPIPRGLLVLHHRELCIGHRDCCNPAHLYLGTNAENMADKMAQGRNRNGQDQKEACPQGHPYAGDNLYLNPGGFRQCKTCVRVASREYRRRKRAER